MRGEHLGLPSPHINHCFPQGRSGDPVRHAEKLPLSLLPREVGKRDLEQIGKRRIQAICPHFAFPAICQPAAVQRTRKAPCPPPSALVPGSQINSQWVACGYPFRQLVAPHTCFVPIMGRIRPRHSKKKLQKKKPFRFSGAKAVRKINRLRSDSGGSSSDLDRTTEDAALFIASCWCDSYPSAQPAPAMGESSSRKCSVPPIGPESPALSSPVSPPPLHTDNQAKKTVPWKQLLERYVKRIM